MWRQNRPHHREILVNALYATIFCSLHTHTHHIQNSNIAFSLTFKAGLSCKADMAQ